MRCHLLNTAKQAKNRQKTALLRKFFVIGLKAGKFFPPSYHLSPTLRHYRRHASLPQAHISLFLLGKV
jgi:hypothetical protein